MPEMTALWSHKQTAAMLGVSTSTLHHMLYKRTAPKSYKVGRHRRYAPQDVEDWLERRALLEDADDG